MRGRGVCVSDDSAHKLRGRVRQHRYRRKQLRGVRASLREYRPARDGHRVRCWGVRAHLLCRLRGSVQRSVHQREIRPDKLWPVHDRVPRRRDLPTRSLRLSERGRAELLRQRMHRYQDRQSQLRRLRARLPVGRDMRRRRLHVPGGSAKYVLCFGRCLHGRQDRPRKLRRVR